MTYTMTIMVNRGLITVTCTITMTCTILPIQAMSRGSKIFLMGSKIFLMGSKISALQGIPQESAIICNTTVHATPIIIKSPAHHQNCLQAT